MVIFGVIGVGFLAFSSAASDSVIVESESTFITGDASVLYDVNTSENQYVEFGSSDGQTWEQALLAATEATNIPPDCHQDESTISSARTSECRVIAQVGMNIMRDWYIKNTGFESYFDPDLNRFLTDSDLDPYPGGEITESNITLDRKKFSGPITIVGNNVTITNSKVEVGGYSYGIDLRQGSNYTIDRVTVEYVGQLGPTKADRGNRAVYANKPGVVRRVKALDGFSSGFRAEGQGAMDILWEYNFLDRLYVTDLNPDGSTAGDHNTSATLRSNLGASQGISGVTYRRNMFLDGTSAAFSFYDKEPSVTHSNLLFEENIYDIFHTSNSDGSGGRGVNYCINSGNSGNYSNVRYIGNVFGQSQRPTNKGDGNWYRKCGSSFPSSGNQGDYSSGNRYIDGNPI